MNEDSLWKQFATTGKVQDYLSYCKEERKNQGHNSTATEDKKQIQHMCDPRVVQRVSRMKSEGSNHERIGNRHGDDINSISDQRVR